MARRLGDCGLCGSTQTRLALRGCSCVDQFLLYDCSCQLTIGPVGHQMVVKKSSTRFARIGVARPCATCDVRDLREVIHVTTQGLRRGKVWSRSFLIRLAGYCICKCRTEGREVVINGSSVLGFLRGSPRSHRIEHEVHSCSRSRVPDDSPMDSSERYNISPRGTIWIVKCILTSFKMSAIEQKSSERIADGCDGLFQFQRAQERVNIRQIEPSVAAWSDCVQRLNATLTCRSLPHFHSGGVMFC